MPITPGERSRRGGARQLVPMVAGGAEAAFGSRAR
jgi:hypothetical protein